jgi:hypothetical protein
MERLRFYTKFYADLSDYSLDCSAADPMSCFKRDKLQALAPDQNAKMKAAGEALSRACPDVLTRR